MPRASNSVHSAAMRFVILCLCGMVGALGDGCTAATNCTGCGCYGVAGACHAAGCSFQDGSCRPTAVGERCPVKMRPGQGAYACRTHVDATRETLKLCNERRLHPFSSQMFAGAAEFAETLARYVRQIVNGSVEEYPLRFAYYTNWLTDSQVECQDAGQGPYQVGGGGKQLCNMLEWNAGLSDKKLAKYLVALMTASNQSALVKAFDSVREFGYEAIESLCESTEKGWPGSVYDPSGAHVSLGELQHEQEQGRPYWGITGGGGAGAGFGISCVGPAGEVPIINGGGGGGGGMTSPAALAAFEAGGGGGGGASVGVDGPSVGAGAGTGGIVGTELQTDPQSWLMSMQLVQDQMRHCHSSGKQLVLRGGGGGGGSFAAQVVDQELPAMSFGYGFEFALAQEASLGALAARHTFGEAAFVSCPGSVDHSCHGCVEEGPQRRLQQEDSKVEGIGALFQCSSRWASSICKAASFNGKQYGQWAHYESCTCPVSHLFLSSYLPNTSEFQWIKSQKHGPHCFPKKGEPLPPLTAEMIQANGPAWCVVPLVGFEACPLLPGCECLKVNLERSHGWTPAMPPVVLLSAVPVLLCLGTVLGLLWSRARGLRRTVTVRELGEEMLKP